MRTFFLQPITDIFFGGNNVSVTFPKGDVDPWFSFFGMKFYYTHSFNMFDVNGNPVGYSVPITSYVPSKYDELANRYQ